MNSNRAGVLTRLCFQLLGLLHRRGRGGGRPGGALGLLQPLLEQGSRTRATALGHLRVVGGDLVSVSVSVSVSVRVRVRVWVTVMA